MREEGGIRESKQEKGSRGEAERDEVDGLEDAVIYVGTPNPNP